MRYQWPLDGPRGRVPVGPSVSRLSLPRTGSVRRPRVHAQRTTDRTWVIFVASSLPFEAPPVNDVDERRDLSSRTGWESGKTICRARSRYETTERFPFLFIPFVLHIQNIHLRCDSDFICDSAHISAAFRCCAWATSGCRAPVLPARATVRGSGLCFACCRLPHLCLAANETHAQVRSCM